MSSIVQFSKQQYEFVRGSRSVLLSYCGQMSQEDFLEANSSFGRGGSIRNLLIHIVNTYEHWVAKIGLGKEIEYTSLDDFVSIDSILRLFINIDSYVFEFIEKIEDFEGAISFQIGGETKITSPFQLFTHVISHEFHHKGQILSLSRHLGYTPVDTDILR